MEAARKAGFEGEITLIGAERHLPYDRPPLSKAYLDQLEPGTLPEPTTFRTEETLRDELGVRLLLGNPATALDTSARTVAVGDQAVPYDAAVIATGATARTLPGPTTSMASTRSGRWTTRSRYAKRSTEERGPS